MTNERDYFLASLNDEDLELVASASGAVIGIGLGYLASKVVERLAPIIIDNPVPTVATLAVVGVASIGTVVSRN